MALNAHDLNHVLERIYEAMGEVMGRTVLQGLAFLAVLVIPSAVLVWWLGGGAAFFAPLALGVLALFEITPEKVLRLGEKIGALGPPRDPVIHD